MRLLAALMLPLLAACSGAPEAAPSADLRPAIVSLNPCTDAILAEVTVPGQLLAISHYSHDPAATSMELGRAQQFAATGGSVEEVLALGPDVVVAGSFLPPAARTAFARLGIRVETFGPPSSVEESAEQIRQIASLAKAEEAGEALAQQIETAWQRAAYDGPSTTTILWQQGGIVPGPDSLAAQLMERSGLSLQSAARGLGQGAYLPLERVLADPPQLLLAAGNDRILGHPAIRQLAGVTYETFDPALLYCGGPSIIAALDRLAQLRGRP